MKKAVTFAEVSQNRQTSNPIYCAESMDFKTLVKAEKEFGKGNLKDLFANPAFKEIFIVLYEVKGSTEVRRLVGGSGSAMSVDQRKQMVLSVMPRRF